MTPSIWQGEGVRLRAVEPGDADAFYRWNLDDEVARLCYEVPFPQSFEKVKEWTEAVSRAAAQNDAYRWIIENGEGVAVGTINTHSCDRRNGTFKYGLAVERTHWGRGYAKEAIRLVLRYFFLELGYQKVTPSVYAFNAASVQLHETLGFQLEGRLRQMVYTDGAHHDELVFGMLREEWEQEKS